MSHKVLATTRRSQTADSMPELVATPVAATTPGEATADAYGLFASCQDLYQAFARFLMVDVANGDATADTIKAYYQEVGSWLKWCHQRGLDPVAIERSHIEAYRGELKVAGLSARTRSYKLSIVRRFYAAGVKHELIKHNPAESVRGGKDLTSAEENMKALTGGALATLMTAIPSNTLSGLRDRAVVALMAIHGLRRVEVHRLQHENLHDEGDTPYLLVDGKGNKRRRVYLRPDTYLALAQYKTAKAAKGFNTEGPVFLAHGNHNRGEALSRRALNRIVDKHLNLSALKRDGVSCHALRHTFGTLAVAGGAKVEHLRDAMGHSKLETTSIYVKAVERARNNPANFIDVTLAPGKGLAKS